MFLFEKSLRGAYSNRLYDLGQRHGPLCYGRIKANSVGKNLDVTTIDTKAGPPNRQICLPLNTVTNKSLRLPCDFSKKMNNFFKHFNHKQSTLILQFCIITLQTVLKKQNMQKFSELLVFGVSSFVLKHSL